MRLPKCSFTHVLFHFILTVPICSSRSSIILTTTRDILARHGLKGLWRGTMPSLARYASFTFPRDFLLIDHSLESNVPGVAMYMTSLTQLRTLMAQSPYFAHIKKSPDGAGTNRNGSVLPSLTSQGNLLAGATTRVTVGFVLNPFSVLKTRFEVRLASVVRSCCR